MAFSKIIFRERAALSGCANQPGGLSPFQGAIDAIVAGLAGKPAGAGQSSATATGIDGDQRPWFVNLASAAK